MKRWGVLLAVAVCMIATSACGDDDNDGTAGPSNQPLVFLATMSAQNEVPAITNAESTATGEVTITITPRRDSANVILDGTATMNFTLRNMPASGSITLAHIHTGAAGVNGGIVVNSQLTAATAIATPAGTASFERSGITVDAATLNSIIANPAAFYYNVHTALNPGGVARGQLRAQ